MEVIDSNITDNEGHTGGGFGIMQVKLTLDIQGCYFENNYHYAGGALYLDDIPSLNVKTSTFNNNTA